VSHLKVQGKPIKSAEQVVIYLAKYLAKAFQMRQNKELSQKVGLLKGMSIYKFFRVIYGYDGERVYIAAKVQKPLISSQVFINNDYGFTEEVEKNFTDYFEKDLKLTEILKLCLNFSSKSKIKKNQF
jgi:hypothetical protein